MLHKTFQNLQKFYITILQGKIIKSEGKTIMLTKLLTPVLDLVTNLLGGLLGTLI